MINQCVSFTGKHKYEARYDEVEIPGALKTYTDKLYKGFTRDYYIRKVYVHDICVHCGDVVDRIDIKENE
jgi:hypothetical protein